MTRPWTRRTWLRTTAAAPLALVAGGARLGAQAPAADVYGAGTLPAGIRSRLVTGVNGITMHVLEAGYDTPGRPGLLLVHGFPELGYSWRKVMLPLAEAGYHVMAPDQRGYGRSGGTDVTFDDDLTPFSTLNRVRDMMALTSALGHRSLVARRRPRLRLAGRGVVRADAAGRVPLRRDDERAVRRHGAAAVQHRQRRRRHQRRRRPTWTKGSRR